MVVPFKGVGRHIEVRITLSIVRFLYMSVLIFSVTQSPSRFYLFRQPAFRIPHYGVLHRFSQRSHYCRQKLDALPSVHVIRTEILLPR